MAELKVKLTAETEQAAKQIDNFGKKAQTSASTASRGFGQLTGAVRGLIPAFATLAGPAAIGAVAIQIVKATAAFKRFERARFEIESLKDAFVAGGVAALKLSQDFGTALKIFQNVNSTTKDYQSALKTVNLELRKYNFVIQDASVASKISGEVTGILIQIRKEEAKQQSLNNAALEKYNKLLLLGRSAQDLSITGYRKLAAELGIVETAFGIVEQQTENASKGFFESFNFVKQGIAVFAGVTRAAAKEANKISGEVKFLGDNASESEEEVRKLVERIGKIPGVNILRDFNAEAEKESAKLADSTKKLNTELERQFNFYDQVGFSLGRVVAAQRLFNDEQQKAIEKQREAQRLQFGGIVSGQQLAVPKVSGLIGKEKIEEAEDALAILRGNIQATSELLASGLVNGFSDVFSAISQGESPIKAITNSIKQLVVRLLAAAAAAAILSALLPGGAIIGGQAVKGFGGIFKGLLGFASGGVATRPTLGVFGEAGPEAVIPLSQLANIIGNAGGGGATTVTGSIRGNEIYLTNQRAGASYTRLFG